MTSKQIRQQFLDFFTQKHAHTFVPSSPVVPLDDPTLLFANAGMNQFKPIFLAVEKRPYSRAVNTQKCIRAGGKHNDLDDVGKDTYHHTFFEMLGNWSFGDYFKKEAIAFAWDLLTNVWNLDKSRLHATVFMGDPAEGLDADRETADLWKSVTDINPDHVHLGNKKDNFWEMGDTGPCGPCSEIHYDRTPDKSGSRLVNAGDPRVIEIWNLVFIQFNRSPDGRLNPLPAKHVDTGMGFERVCAVIQGKDSNYDTDVFAPLLTAIADLAKTKYTTALDNPVDIAFRVIADHARTSTFAITDGATPSNKKRGAVLRSVIRRAVRFGYQILKLQEPFLHKLVPVIVEQMGDAFPELRRNPNPVIQTIKTEETDFLATIERGLRIFDESATKAAANNKIITGADVFNLHATLGFPADLTVQLALERALSVDMDEYNRLWAEHVAISGAGRKQHAQVAVDLTAFNPTDDSPKYQGFTTEATILGYLTEHEAQRTGCLKEDDPAALLLDRTTFYAEQGGQVGDIGAIQTPTGIFDVTATERKGDHVLHWGAVREGTLSPNQQAAIRVDPCRADTMRNHTTTHLLNFALKKVLGDHIEQKGSSVDPEKLRFDFSHPHALTAEQTTHVERIVNEKIYSDLPVSATVMPLTQAKNIPGVRAVFGEKYPDPVRVIAIGTDNPATSASPDMSIEFCGGTHLTRTSQAGFFKIIAEEAVAKGVRRLTAVTGRAAVQHVQHIDQILHAISQSLSASPDDAPKRIATLHDEIKQLKKKLASGAGAKSDPLALAAKLLESAPSLGPGKLIVGEIPAATDEQLRAAMDSLKKKSPSHAILLASADDQKVTFVAAVSDDLIAKGLKAGDWVREAAKVAGGGGGGRPQMAQAGGKDPAKLPDALQTAKTFATGVIK
ncbi:MAG: alanine--tRNA ligase [Planctomycetota bacterium]|nr:alanine--tRNA ligase [Planctomycetota bacterium]